ncbi:tetratricopeptide (TPR) repeat protein [Bradyrhizobium sp. LM6.9]
MCGTHLSAQMFSFAKISLRSFLLSAAMSVVLVAPALSGVDCVMGSKAAPAELIPACSAIIDQASNPSSDRAAALLVRADANARTSGGVTQALRDIDRAIALEGRNAKAWRLRGDLLREAGGDLNRAAADLSKAIELDPQDAESYELRGVVYTNQHRLDRALADYDQAIKLKPDNAQTWSDRGVTYYLGGDNDKAIRDLSEALRLDPNRPRSYTNRGAAYKKVGQLDKAVADDGEAIRLDPKVPEYYDNRGLSLAAMGEYDKAIADYDQALRLAPRPNFFTNRGDSYHLKGELGAALSDYEAALKLDPNFAQTYNNRAVLYKKMGGAQEGAGRLRDRATARSRQRQCRQRPPNHDRGDREIRRRAAVAARGEFRQWPVVRLCHGEARGREDDLRRSTVGRARPPDCRDLRTRIEVGRLPLGRRPPPHPARFPRHPQYELPPAGL